MQRVLMVENCAGATCVDGGELLVQRVLMVENCAGATCVDGGELLVQRVLMVENCWCNVWRCWKLLWCKVRCGATCSDGAMK